MIRVGLGSIDRWAYLLVGSKERNKRFNTHAEKQVLRKGSEVFVVWNWGKYMFTIKIWGLYRMSWGFVM